ncbi:MAG TPA: phospholipid carrier-dependent glycosyltransferase [Planctomycetaceae bacterium]|nr:phospholipid carrier-dependent glycosyltransferase [Planctomycetaceae bacterium]
MATPPAPPPARRFLPSRDALLHALGPAVIALLAWLVVVTHLDPGGSDPASGEGPGLTIDESFNVQNGVLLVEAWRSYGIALVFPESAREVFHPREGVYLNDHPPLGRFWLGLHHHLAWWWKPPQGSVEPYHPIRSCVTARARTGSATAFSLTILLLGTTASVWYGRTVGVLTAIMYVSLPRVFGHAHIASLESFTNLTYTATVIAAACAWRETVPSMKTTSWAGAVYGLALLSKMQAVFIPIPLAVWALWRWRHRAVLPLVVWGGVALVVFVIGWPTHWFEPWDSIPKYFRGAADRASLSVWLNGTHYTDKTVPRSYVLITFLWTVPLVIPVLAVLGVAIKARWLFLNREGEAPAEPRWGNTLGIARASAGASPSRDSAEWLVLMEAVFPLIMFSLPRVPVYDAERLWLPALPLLVLSAAAGLSRGLAWMQTRAPRWQWGIITATALLLALPLLTAWRIAPCYLSSANVAMGGLRAAERSGQELDYWGNSVTRSFLQDVIRNVPRGSTIAVAPVLHQFQVDDLLQQSPILRAHEVKLVAYDPKSTTVEYLLVFRRRADLPSVLEERLRDGPRLAEVTRDGVVLAGLMRAGTEAP